MKKAAIFVLALAPFFPANDAAGADVKIHVVFDRHEMIVKMFDNPASRDFLSLLPLSLEFEDYARAEKIAYLPRRLDTGGAPASHDPTGDFAYYAPWGNLAVFYKGFGRDERLYALGSIESGKEKLASLSWSFTAKIEVVE